MLCAAVHPTRPEVTCTVDAEVNHRQHLGMVMWPREDLCWDNPAWVAPPEVPRPEDSRVKLADMRRRAVRERHVRTTLTFHDPQAGAEGSETAAGHMSPEFLEAAAQGAREISLALPRWTADDLWDWLLEHGHHTDHPKGMAAILKRLYRDGVIAPVPDDDPDAYRLGRRTNASRRLRVYASRLYPGDPVGA